MKNIFNSIPNTPMLILRIRLMDWSSCKQQLKGKAKEHCLEPMAFYEIRKRERYQDCFLRLFLNSVGVIPTLFLNTRENVNRLVKPTSPAR